MLNKYTSKDLIDPVHSKLGIFFREAHGWFELQNIPVWTISTKKDSMFLQPAKINSLLSKLASICLPLNI